MKSIEALTRALAALRAAGTPLILLRERAFDARTASSPGDYDLLAPDGALDRVLETWHASILATEASCLVHYSKPEKRHIVLFDPREDLGIHVDLWREHRIDVPIRGKRHTRVLNHSALAPHCSFQGDVLRMASWLELVVYFCHLFEKKKHLAAEGVHERLGFYTDADMRGSGCPADLLEELSSAPSRLLEGRMTAEQAAAWATAVLDRLGMIRESPSRVEAARWWWRKKSRSVARRLGAGPVVAVQGPDGAGKTTIINAIANSSGSAGRPLQTVVFKRLYRHSIFRWLYKIVRKLRRIRRRDEPKEVVEAALAPFLFAGALINYRLQQAFSGRGKVRVFDRFFPDLLVTNRKEEGGAIDFTRAHRVLRRFVPRMSCAVLLAARPEVLRSRKAEMTDENARRYVLLMTSHYTRHPPADLLVLRTDMALERSAAILARVMERVD